MTPEEVRLELDATTLRPQDLSEEGRGMLQQDAGLAAWVERRKSFDEQVAAFMVSGPAPQGLRGRLLALEQAGPGYGRRRVWLKPALMAAAAAVVLLGWLWSGPVFDALPPWQSEAMRVVNQLEHGRTRLTERADNLAALRGYLAARHSPAPGRMPGRIDQTRTFGCKLIEVDGRPATIVCFRLDGGREAHLVIVDNASGPEKETSGGPRLSSQDGWNMAAWSDGAASYLLATTADAAALKRLLGLV